MSHGWRQLIWLGTVSCQGQTVPYTMVDIASLHMENRHGSIYTSLSHETLDAVYPAEGFYDGAFLRSNGVGLRRKYHGVASTPTLGSSRSSSDRDNPSACDATLHTSQSGPVPPPDMYLSLVRHILSNPLFWRYRTVRLAIYYLTPHIYSSPNTHI